jgi:hypothetical protein
MAGILILTVFESPLAFLFFDYFRDSRGMALLITA